jgi:signal transduction histidine kinase
MVGIAMVILLLGEDRRRALVSLQESEARLQAMLEHARAARAQTEVLACTGRFLGQTLDADTVAQRIVDSMGSLLRLQTALLFRLEPRSGDLVTVAVSGATAPLYPGAILSPGTGTAGRAVRERRPVVTADILADPRISLTADMRARMERSSSYRAVLTVPLLIHDTVIGALSLGDVRQRAFSDDDVQLAQAFADYAALAFENARLYSDAARQRREAQVVAELARTLNASHDLDSVLRGVEAGAKDLCACDGIRIALRDRGTREPVFRSWSHRGAEDQTVARIERGRGLGGRVIETGRPLRTSGVAPDEPAGSGDGWTTDVPGGVSVMIVPITIAGEVEGLIRAERRTPGAFDDRDEAVLLQLADTAAIAIENLRLLRDERTARAEAESAEQRVAFLVEVGEVLSASLDYQTTLMSLARLTVPYLADWCAIDVVQDDDSFLRLAVVHHDPTRDEATRELRRRYPPEPGDAHGPAHVLRTKRSEFRPVVAAATVDARDEDHRRLLRELGLTSYMCVPLVARGRMLGAISFVHATAGRRFSRDDLGLAEAVARRAAIAVDNARLFRDAEAASQAKDEFLATLSHELRTPLHAMLGWTRMLRMGSLDERTRLRALETLERNTRLQAQLIEDLLDVSRLITGKLRIDVQTVELAPVLDAALDAVRATAEAKGVHLDTRMDPAVGPVTGDPQRLQQVAWNLLSNAIKFTPAGGRVRIDLAASDGHARIRVADTGAGIGADFLPHVFERFRQAEGASARGFGGLGLGLAIVRHIVELHGGTVRAESAGERQGATFTVELPLGAPPGAAC